MILKTGQPTFMAVVNVPKAEIAAPNQYIGKLTLISTAIKWRRLNRLSDVVLRWNMTLADCAHSNTAKAASLLLADPNRPANGYDLATVLPQGGKRVAVGE
jgi:hypothetical protein